MIVVNNNIEQHELAYLYCPIGEYIGQITNVISLLDVRRQIREGGKGGYVIHYYVKTGREIEHAATITIDANGKLDNRPPGFFDKMDDLLDSLI